MTYRCGIGPGIPGLEPGRPHIYCDECGLKLDALKKDGSPYAWLMNNKAPPGWRLLRTDVPFTRKDICPTCVKVIEYESKNEIFDKIRDSKISSMDP